MQEQPWSTYAASELSRTTVQVQVQFETRPGRVGREVCVQTLLPSVSSVPKKHLLFSINPSLVKVHCSQALDSVAGSWGWAPRCALLQVLGREARAKFSSLCFLWQTLRFCLFPWIIGCKLTLFSERKGSLGLRGNSCL